MSSSGSKRGYSRVSRGGRMRPRCASSQGSSSGRGEWDRGESRSCCSESQENLNQVQVASTDDQLKVSKVDNVVDAADFLLSNSQYHDCCLVVGNPDTDNVERIGVASTQLIAHSPVLREMIKDSKVEGASDSKIHITDVCPATFILLLRYVYGGKLPQMTAIEAAGLALCADKFKIPRLMRKALKRLNPSDTADVFPALVCVTYIRLPELEVKVRKIIERETDKIVEHPDFLLLEEDCVVFILTQDTLNISELEVWRSVVRWAEHRVESNPCRTLRECLTKILGHVRLLTLTLEEIAEHVLPTKIISPEEFVDLTLTLMKKQTLESPSLCKTVDKRGIYKDDNVKVCPSNVEIVNNASVSKDNSKIVNIWRNCCFDLDNYYEVDANNNDNDLRETTLIIEPNDAIEIVSFQCITSVKPIIMCNSNGGGNCEISVTKTVDDNVIDKQVINVNFGHRRTNRFSVPVNCEHPLILNPGETCTFTLRFDFPVWGYYLASDESLVPVIIEPLNNKTVTFPNNKTLVLAIDYKTQQWK